MYPNQQLSQLVFLSTLSLRRATRRSPPRFSLQWKFLSTLSLRRATKTLFTVGVRSEDFYPRSPCGERQTLVRSVLPTLHFYPRSPCGERHDTISDAQELQYISIHALLAESDPDQQADWWTGDSISIHALLAESDAVNAEIGIAGLVFLSTLSLRRATHDSQGLGQTVQFLSTLSLRRATSAARQFGYFFSISIHALLAESDGTKKKCGAA